MEFLLTYLAIGFITVFGWNSGQKVWDKYIEPPAIEQPADKIETPVPPKKDALKKYNGKTKEDLAGPLRENH
jgi:hypothetical protein